MKYVSFTRNGSSCFGAVVNGGVVDLSGRFGAGINSFLAGIKSCLVILGAQRATIAHGPKTEQAQQKNTQHGLRGP